jgi:hypothetical protein
MTVALQAFSVVSIVLGLLIYDIQLFLAISSILLVIASVTLAVWRDGLKSMFAPLWVTVAIASILLCVIIVNNYFSKDCVLKDSGESMNFLSKFTTNFCPKKLS